MEKNKHRTKILIALSLLVLLNALLWGLLFRHFGGPAGVLEVYRDLRETSHPRTRAEMLGRAMEPFGDQSAFERERAFSGLTNAQVVRLFLDHDRALAAAELARQEKSEPLSDPDLRAIYDAHPEAWQLPELLEARHIFLIAAENVTPPEEIAQQETKIRRIAQKLQTGGDFAALAAEFSEDPATNSEGGLLPIFTPAQTPEVFRRKVAELEPGETSQPFYEPRLGWHIVRLEQRKPPRQATFDEVKPLLKIENPSPH